MNTKIISAQLAEKTQKIITGVTRLTGGFQNEVYRFGMDDESFIARLTPAKKRSKELIEAELAFMERVRSNGIQTPEIQILFGENVNELKVDREIYWVTVFRYVDGNEMDVSNLSQWNSSFFFEWGKTIGKIHDISQSLQAEIKRPIWIEDDRDVNPLPLLLKESDKWLKEIYETLIWKMESFPKTEKSFGLIHQDLHQGNFFVKSNKLVLFDFDDCCYNWFVQDLATSIYHALWTGSSFHPEWLEFKQEFLNHFLGGYLSIRPLTEVDVLQMGMFLQMREIFLYLLFKKTWHPHEMEQWQSEKLVELEENLRNDRIPFEQEISIWKDRNFPVHLE